jgi:hypothetical protein
MEKSPKQPLWLDGLKNPSPAGQDIVPFYRHKDMVYNTWLTGISIPYLQTKLPLEGS